MFPVCLKVTPGGHGHCDLHANDIVGKMSSCICKHRHFSFPWKKTSALLTIPHNSVSAVGKLPLEWQSCTAAQDQKHSCHLLTWKLLQNTMHCSAQVAQKCSAVQEFARRNKHLWCLQRWLSASEYSLPFQRPRAQFSAPTLQLTTICSFRFRGSDAPLLASETLHTGNRHTSKTPTHINFFKKLNNN